MCSSISFATANESLMHEEETELLQPSGESTTHITNFNKFKKNASLTEPSTPTAKCDISPISNRHATPEICKENNCEESNANACSICTESTSVYAVAQCNHRICYVCALRSRILLGTNSCPFCRAKQHKVIFTHDSTTPFSVLMSSISVWYLVPDHQILCEDQQIHHMTTEMIKFRCPMKSCRAAYGGWPELIQHVRNDHKLMFCGRCIAHRKIFTWEHILYTKEELKRHYRSGDAKDFNFRGHPSCIECNVTFYDLIEFREHYLMHHSLIPMVESPSLLTTINNATANNVLDSDESNGFDISALFFFILSVFTTLLGTFSIPDDNKYFASIIQTLDGLTSSIDFRGFLFDHDILGTEKLVHNDELDSVLYLWGCDT
ncbi:5471_t:CDS:2 [Acaulospora morrowiae]|uniref:5471_t:CDS:1 n=1 Tax=Acaulospora morrowiae TaxID=94023 RepID=A0A9N9CGL6_9GLOM|nr:5471_t:CDS:2 [Acaulospora morrowiae]